MATSNTAAPGVQQSAPSFAQVAVTSRGHLSFVGRNAAGHLVNWISEPRVGQWEIDLVKGRRRFGEVAELAMHDELEAYNAIRFALSGNVTFQRGADTDFEPLSHSGGYGWGMEAGFSQAIAELVITGLRALQCGAIAFDPEAASAGGAQ